MPRPPAALRRRRHAPGRPSRRRRPMSRRHHGGRPHRSTARPRPSDPVRAGRGARRRRARPTRRRRAADAAGRPAQRPSATRTRRRSPTRGHPSERRPRRPRCPAPPRWPSTGAGRRPSEPPRRPTAPDDRARAATARQCADGHRRRTADRPTAHPPTPARDDGRDAARRRLHRAAAPPLHQEPAVRADARAPAAVRDRRRRGRRDRRRSRRAAASTSGCRRARASLLGELLRGGEIGYELSLDPRTPIVVGVYPMRPVARA